MNERMKIEFIDTGVSAPQRPVLDDSSILNPNNITAPASGLHAQKPAGNPPARTKRLREERDAMPLNALPVAMPQPLIENAETKQEEFPALPLADSAQPLSQPLANVAQQPAAPVSQPASDAPSNTTTPAAKAPGDCGCGKKSKKRKAKKSLVVEAGETKRFDKCAHFDKIENKGKIELAEGASLTAVEFINSGSISSQFDLALNAENFNAVDGSVESPSKIVLTSKGDLTVRGGDFRAPAVKFDAEGKLDVYAHRVDGKASVKASGVSFGVKEGDLNVEEHICTGDPVYWNEATTGTFSLPDIATFGEDLVIWSNSPSILVGNIDTTGDTGPGRVTIITNAGATRPGTPSENPYDCSDCSSHVPNNSGDGGGTVTINADESLPSINAKGPVEIRGNLTSGTVSQPGYIWIKTPDTLSGTGGANSIKIKGDITTHGQLVILAAGNKIEVDGNITTGNSSLGGSVEIQAYKGADGGGTSSEFVIGGSGQTNGVNGNINCSTSGAGNNGNEFIFVRNYGNGGIKLESTSALNVQIGNGKTGSIAFDAKDGAVTLPAGTISVDGAGSQAAGRIFLAGDSIVATAGATTLTASDQGSGIFHKVQMAAATYSYGSGGLTVKSNGGGGQQNDPSVGVFAKGSLQFTTTINPPFYTFLVSANPDTTKSITVSGSGALKLEANSLNAGPRQLWCVAKDMTFNGGTVEMECHGKDGLVKVWSFGAMKFAGGAATMKSNGYQNSDGGFVDMYCHTFERTSTSTLEMHADGDGKGNGGRAQLWADTLGTNTITLGRTAGSVHATADGGSADGNGGRIDIVSGSETASGAPIVIKDSADEQNPVLSVAPKGSDGDGGSISVRSAGNVTFNEANNKLSADGKGNGKGGSISLAALRTGAALDLGDNIVSAKGGDTGDGGTILLTSNTALTMKAAKLTVTVGQGDKSNGKGGIIYGKSEAGDITVEGTLNTDGKGKGKGGKIILDAKQTLNYGTNDFTAKGGNKGDGGLIWLKSGTNFTIAGSKTHVDPGQDSDSSGEGGTIQIESGDDLTITGMMNANGKGKGKGGNILLTAQQTATISDSAALHCDGGCAGPGGITNINCAAFGSTDSVITASGGVGDCGQIFCHGGYVRITTTGSTETQISQDITANGKNSGTGGFISLDCAGALTFEDGELHAVGGDTGNGGTVQLISAGSQEVDGLQISVSAGVNGNGDGGTISCKTDSDLALLRSLAANGFGSGNGGKLILRAKEEIDLEDSFLFAIGGTTGNGGSIRLTTGARFEINGTQFEATPGIDGDGNGGEIIITGDSLTLSGLLNAAGRGNGNGNIVTLVARSSEPLLIKESAQINAESGDNNGNGGVVTVSNERGNIVVEDNVEINASASGGHGNGGNITFSAGSAADGSIEISGQATTIEAESGLFEGAGGHIALLYSDHQNKGSVNIKNATVQVDRLGDGADGQIEVRNLASAYPLYLFVENGELKAVKGVINVNQPGANVFIAADRETEEPLSGFLNVKAQKFTMEYDVAPERQHALFVGEIDASKSATFDFGKGGSLVGREDFLVKTPLLSFAGYFEGVQNLRTDTQEINSDGNALYNNFTISNESESGVKLTGQWSIRNGMFVLDSNTDVTVGGEIEQHGPGAGIFITVTAGTLTVNPGVPISAHKGSIALTVQAGNILIGTGAEIAAEAEGKNTEWGNVDIQVLPATLPSNGTDGQFPNLTVFPTTAAFICGPNGLTANAPNNGLAIANRRLSLKGPFASSITLNGGIKINVLGQVA